MHAVLDSGCRNTLAASNPLAYYKLVEHCCRSAICTSSSSSFSSSSNIMETLVLQKCNCIAQMLQLPELLSGSGAWCFEEDHHQHELLQKWQHYKTYSSAFASWVKLWLRLLGEVCNAGGSGGVGDGRTGDGGTGTSSVSGGGRDLPGAYHFDQLYGLEFLYEMVKEMMLYLCLEGRQLVQGARNQVELPGGSRVWMMSLEGCEQQAAPSSCLLLLLGWLARAVARAGEVLLVGPGGTSSSRISRNNSSSSVMGLTSSLLGPGGASSSRNSSSRNSSSRNSSSNVMGLTSSLLQTEAAPCLQRELVATLLLQHGCLWEWQAGAEQRAQITAAFAAAAADAPDASANETAAAAAATAAASLGLTGGFGAGAAAAWAARAAAGAGEAAGEAAAGAEVAQAAAAPTVELHARLANLPQEKLPTAVVDQVKLINNRRWSMSFDLPTGVDLGAAGAFFEGLSQVQQQQFFGDFLQLSQLLLVEVPMSLGCSNPGCVGLAGQSEVAVSNKACTGCKVVYYCSRGCQVDHWKVHRRLCKGLQQ